jgi:hypothetical protein
MVTNMLDSVFRTDAQTTHEYQRNEQRKQLAAFDM